MIYQLFDYSITIVQDLDISGVNNTLGELMMK